MTTQSPLLKLKTAKYLDKEVSGIEAFSILIPEDWKFEGGIQWRLDPMLPAVMSFRAFNPHDVDVMEMIPQQMFFWSPYPMFTITAQNQRAVLAPMKIEDALQQLVITPLRGKEKNLKIIEFKELANLASNPNPNIFNPMTPAQMTSGGKIRIEYQQNDVWMTEEIFGVVKSMNFGSYMFWTLDYLFAFKSRKENFSAHEDTFQIMLSSFRLNLEWFNHYMQLVEYIKQMQISQIRHIGEISNIMRQTSNEISDMIMQNYEENQAVYDRMRENFTDYQREVNTFHDSAKNEDLKVPIQYDYVWSNGIDQHVFSTDPSYDPNIGSTQHWERIHKK